MRFDILIRTCARSLDSDVGKFANKTRESQDMLKNDQHANLVSDGVNKIKVLNVVVDSDRAGCPKSRCST